MAQAGRQQAQRFGAFQQGNIARVGHQFRVRARLRQHQELHDKFGVNHAAGAELDVEFVGLDRVCAGHAVAHGGNFGTQAVRIAWRADHRLAHRIKAFVQGRITEHTARPCHGLVFPGPGGVGTALLLVVGVGGKAGDQQAGIAVGAQRRVNFIQVAFAGLDSQPVDELAHQRGIDLRRVFVVVVKDKHDVQIAAVAQFLAAQFAVGNDAKPGLRAVRLFQLTPAPAGGDSQDGIGQRAQVVGHLLHREFALDVARQGTKDFGVVGAAQQVEQAFLVVLAGAGQ
jgi:hypothetical protein